MTTAEQRQKWAEEERDDLADRLHRKQQQVDELRVALSDAADAFEECTSGYAQGLASDDLKRWRRLAGDETYETEQETA